MPYFRVEFTATAAVENTLVVRADSPEDAADEALKQLNQSYQGIRGLRSTAQDITPPTSPFALGRLLNHTKKPKRPNY